MTDKPVTSECIEKLKWSEARARLGKNDLDEKCRNLIEAANEAAHGLKNDAHVFILRYAFGSHIIKDKHLVLPQTDRASSSNVPQDTVPVCLLLSHQAEVYVPSQTRCDLPCSLRLLEAGDLFGVFEAANRFTHLPPPTSDWWVAAGARTARLLYPMDNQSVRQYLYEELSSDEQAQIAFVGEKRLEDWSWHLMVGLAHIYAPDWYTEVLMFPNSWFQGKRCVSFQCEVLKTAWQQVQADNICKLRRIAISRAVDQETALSIMAGNQKIGRNNCIQVLALLDDLVNARAVVHVPILGTPGSEVGGPFQTIAAGIERNVVARRRCRPDQTMSLDVLAPAYLTPGASGFVSFSRPAVEGAMLSSKRMAEFLLALGGHIQRTHDLVKTLDLLIPQVDWPKLCFYGQFISGHKEKKSLPHFCSMTDKLPVGGGRRIHSSNRFFLHSAHITRRR